MDKLKIKSIFTLLIIAFIFWDDITGSLELMIRHERFLYVQYVGLFFYVPLLAVLTYLSLSLKKSEIKWQKTLGIIGIYIVILDLIVNLIAFVWNLM